MSKFEQIKVNTQRGLYEQIINYVMAGPVKQTLTKIFGSKSKLFRRKVYLGKIDLIRTSQKKFTLFVYIPKKSLLCLFTFDLVD